MPSRAITCHHVSSVSLEVLAGESENLSPYLFFKGIFGDTQSAHDVGVVLRRKEELKAAREKRAKELKRGPGVEN